MANISTYGVLYHLRAEPNQFILHYKRGSLTAKGNGLAYWFDPFSAAIALVPAEDCETTFVLTERCADFQEASVQITLTYRFADPEKAATRFNFAISIQNGIWLEKPLERVANLWRQKAQQPARVVLATIPIAAAATRGPESVRAEVEKALRADPELAAMGLQVVIVQVDQIAPSPDLEKALLTPTREAIQQKADEAVFARRALAVEKERAIKENELATEIEIARRQEQLIDRQNANKLLAVRGEAESEKARVESEGERQALQSEAYARDVRTRSVGDADARRTIAEADVEAERQRLAAWSGAGNRAVLALALQELATKIKEINHLNLTPDLLSESFKTFLTSQDGK